MTRRRPSSDDGERERHGIESASEAGANPEQAAMEVERRDPAVLRRWFDEHPDLESRFGSVESVIARLAGADPEPVTPLRDPLATSKAKRLRRNSLPRVPKSRPAPELDELRAALAVTVRLGPLDYPEARRLAQAALDSARPDDPRVRVGEAAYRAGGVRASAIRNAVKAVVWNAPDVWVKPAGEPARPQFREYLDTEHDRRMRAAYDARTFGRPENRVLTPEQEALDRLSLDELTAMLDAIASRKP